MVKLTQNSWASGQLDREMSGRQDMKQYRNGASVLKNFLPVLRGSIRKRPGTDLIDEITDYLGDEKFRIIPFGYMSDNGCVLIFSDHKARAYQSNGLFVEVSGDIPYAADDLDELVYVQCGDVVFLAHRDYPPAEIKHTEADVFVFNNVRFNPVVTRPTITSATYTRAWFQDFTFETDIQDTLDVYKTKAAADVESKYWDKYYQIYNNEQYRKYNGKTVVNYKASVLLDGSEGPLSAAKSIQFTSPWTESQVATIVVSVSIPSGVKAWELRLYKENGGVYGLVGSTKGTSSGSQSRTFKDDNIAADASISPIDSTDGTPFATPGNYPGCVGLYQQRLVWASTYNDPARIWMSMVGDFYEYRPHEKLQLDDAIDFILPITQFANINFIIELGRLFAFSECTELVVGSASDNQGISYETIIATEHSHLGSTKRLPPIIANNSLLFVSRTGRSVRDYDVNIQNSRFGGTDVSVFSSSIFENDPIVDWTWQQEPNYTIWCVLASGKLASLTYFKEHEFNAWAVHELGGGGKARGVAKSCAVTGGDAVHKNTDEIFVIVERMVDGRKTLTLEKMRPWGLPDDDADLRVCMDCVQHGEVFGKAYVPEADVSGYPIESVMQTMQPVIGSDVGQAQFDIKLGQHAHLRTIDSVGGECFAIGMENQATPIPESENGDVDILLSGSNNRDGRVIVRQSEPWPFQLSLLELDYEAEEGT